MKILLLILLSMGASRMSETLKKSHERHGVIILLKDNYKSKGKTKAEKARDIKVHNLSKTQVIANVLERKGYRVKRHTIIPAIFAELKREDILEILKSWDVLTFPNDTLKLLYFMEPNTHNFGWNIRRVMADSVWENTGLTGEGIIVGFIDSGVDAEHPALSSKYLGYFYDAVNHLEEPYDDFGHGTHVTGTVVGGDGPGDEFPDSCDVGIAYGAKFVMAKAFAADGTGTTEWILECYDWLLELIDSGININIISNSWGDYNETNLIYFAINETLREIGVIPVYAIGNAGPSPHSTAVPGNYPLVIGVGATDYDDDVAYFSSRGPAPNEEPWNNPSYWPVYNWNLLKPDISAPGVDIRSTVPGGYEAGWSGTSMATPHVTATIALMLQKNPSLSFDAIYEILKESADRPDSTLLYPNNNYGWGRLNSYKAVLMTPPLNSPYPVVTHFILSDTLGNSNGIPEPGEILVMTIEVKNLGDDYLSVEGEISITDSEAMVITGTATFGTILRGDTALSTPFVISTLPTRRPGKPLNITLTLTGNDLNGGIVTFNRQITFEVGIPEYYTWISEDFENGFLDWVTGGTAMWGLDNNEYHSPIYSATDSPEGNYSNNAHTYLRLKWPIPLRDVYHARILFWNKHYLEVGSGGIFVDKGYVEASRDSSDDAQWVKLKVVGGMEGGWALDSADLSPLCGEERVYIRFLLESDVSYALDGWYIDDIEIQFDKPRDSLFLYIDGIKVCDSLTNGNGFVDPGEEVNLSLSLRNLGYSITPPFFAELRSESDDITIIQATSSFGSLSPYQNEWGNFVIKADSNAQIGESIPLKLYLSGGIYDTLNLTIMLSDSSFLPTPDIDYGYYAIEDIDISPLAPQVNWVELSDGLGSIVEEVSNGDADTVTIPLPFTFTFYGTQFDSIGISSNGFLELGCATYRWGDNSPIPSPTGPCNLIAPFWDDLDTYQHGDVYQYYDAENHRFIIEFNEVAHHTWPSLGYETFEVILVDPQFSGTPTGDGEIYFLYKDVGYYKSATIGIESPSGTDGIQMNNNTLRPRTASPPEPGRVILFTTKTPLLISQKYETPHLTLKVYPVPACGNLMLDLGGRELEGPIKIYDVSGRLRLTLKCTGLKGNKKTRILDLRNFKSGVYFLKINGCTQPVRFIILK